MTISQMAIVCEEDDLRLLGELSENLEAGHRAVIIEVDEQVIDDQRKRLDKQTRPRAG